MCLEVHHIFYLHHYALFLFYSCLSLVNPRRACAGRVTVVGSVCVSVTRDHTNRPTKDTTCNEGQKICVVSSENALLQS